MRKGYGEKLDGERERKRDVILQLIAEEALKGRVYTANQFAEKFENKAGLGARATVAERISVLATKGYIKFFRNPKDYGLPKLKRGGYGYLCVEGMRLGPPREAADSNTGEIVMTTLEVLPTHYKSAMTGAILEVENPHLWIYPEGEK